MKNKKTKRKEERMLIGKKEIDNKLKIVVVVFSVLLLALLSISVISAGYTKTYNYNSLTGGLGSIAGGFFGETAGQFDRSMCEAGQDFVLQIAPFGCSPAVARSDLLEEQNVPIYCQISATKINPLIDVKAIDWITFSGQTPPEVAGVSFFPNNAALGTGRETTLNTYPVLENIGYAVIVLKRELNESAMPEYVEGNLTAKIRYNIENAWGVGQASYYLPLLTDNEFNDRYKSYGFWDGRGFLRAESIGNDGAVISVYSGKTEYSGDRQRIDSIQLKEGVTSDKIYMTGFNYCLANMRIRLDDITYPDTRAKIKVNADLYEVADGETFLDGKCNVLSIDKYGINEEVEIKCNEDINSGLFGSKAFTLKLAPKVQLEINGQTGSYGLGDFVYESENKKGVYVGYIGSADNSGNKNSLRMYLVETSVKDSKLSDEKINQISSYIGGRFEATSSSPTRGAILDTIVNIVDIAAGGIGEVAEKSYEVITGDDLEFFHYSIKEKFLGTDVTIIGFAGAVDAELDAQTMEYYQKAIDDYDEVLTSFASETYNSLELGKETFLKKINFAALMQQNKKVVELCDELSQTYPNEKTPFMCSNALQLSNEESSTRHVTINGKVKEISFDGIYRPSKDEYGIEGYAIDKKTGKTYPFSLRKDQIKYFDTDAKEFMQLKEIKDENSVSLSLRTIPEGVLDSVTNLGTAKTVSFQRNIAQVVGNYEITINKINLKRVAKVSVLPNIDYSGTETTFKFKIGIEKRSDLLKLSPEQAKTKIDSLNDSINKLDKISSGLGNVVKGLKTACLATGALFTVDNLLSNLNGKGLARQKVMRDTGGWYDQCKILVKQGKYSTLQDCLFENSDKINNDVDRYYDSLSTVNKKISDIEKANVINKGGLFSEDVINTTALLRLYSQDVQTNLASCAGTEFADPSGKQAAVKISDVTSGLSFNMWSTKKNYNFEELRDIGFYCDILKKDPNDASAKQKLYSLMFDVKETAKAYAEANNYATALGVSSDKVMFIDLGKSKPYNYQGLKYSDIKSKVPAAGAFGIVDTNPVQIIYTNMATKYILILDDSTGGDKLPVKKTSDGIDGKFMVYDINGILVNDPPKELQGGIYFTKITSASYNNKYNNPEVKYFETEPFKGAPALVPLDIEKGWYVALSQTLPGFGNVRSFDESGRVYSYYLGNTGTDGNVNFFEGGGDDISQLVVLGSKETFSKFSGLSDSEVSSLVKKAEEVISSVQKQYSAGVQKVNVPGVGSIKVGSPSANIPQVECEDFMSPKQCKILFNVCDPVICPSSRCDLGGAYPVADVVQSGVIGSIALCLPNIQEGIVVPVCLTGVKAGLDSWIGVEKSYRDCLKENIDTGRTIGICDEIQSIYACEFFWRQSLPVAKIILPTIASTILGQNARGGGEYLGVASAFQNAEKSVDYFTQYYGAKSFEAFKARTTDEVGGEVCKSFVSGVYPSSGNFLDALTEADSPPQFTGRFDEIPFTTATNPPISQYKVFYYIFSGKDSGAYFRVYLKGSPGSSYYQDTAISRIVDSGYIEKGGYKTNTVDFTAPSGYNQLCILVNGQEECGFKQVSTDFTVNYIQDKYASEQATIKVTSEAECISGTPSLYSLFNPNLQEGVGDLANPELFNQGIYRICATNNPGQGTDSLTGTEDQRWVDVGYCGNQNMRCWLDKQSVKDVIKNSDIEGNTVEEINKQIQANLEAAGQIPDFEATLEKIKETTDDKTVINIINEVIGKFYRNNQKGRLLMLRGDAYGNLAFGLFKTKADEKTNAPEIKLDGSKEYCIKSVITGETFKVRDITNVNSWCSDNGGGEVCDKISTGQFVNLKKSLYFECSDTTAGIIPGISGTTAPSVIPDTIPKIKSSLWPARVRIVRSSGINIPLIGDVGDLLREDYIYEWNDTAWRFRNDNLVIKTYSDGLVKIRDTILEEEGKNLFSRVEVQCGSKIIEVVTSYSLFSTNVIEKVDKVIRDNCAETSVTPSESATTVICTTKKECQILLGDEVIRIAREIKKEKGISDNLVKQQTGAKNFECLVLQQAYQESVIQQCTQYQINGDPLYCNGKYDNTLKSAGDEKSYGIMMININANPTAKANEFLNNINFGINYLVNGYNLASKQYDCNGKTYSGWTRALRGYNGWGIDCTKGDINYVENVLNKKVVIEALFPETCK